MPWKNRIANILLSHTGVYWPYIQFMLLGKLAPSWSVKSVLFGCVCVYPLPLLSCHLKMCCSVSHRCPRQAEPEAGGFLGCSFLNTLLKLKSAISTSAPPFWFFYWLTVNQYIVFWNIWSIYIYEICNINSPKIKRHCLFCFKNKIKAFDQYGIKAS